DPYVSAYAYVNGNPVRFVDPSGRCLQFAAGGLVLAPVTGGVSAVAGAAATIGCGVAVGALFVLAGAAAWVTGSAAGKALGDLSRGDPTHREWTPPIPDQRSSTPLIVQLGPELGYGTPGGSSGLPAPCRKLGLSWKSCAALGLLGTAGGGLTYALDKNSEGIPKEGK
ncbi:MAG: hypothetical protein Q8N51_07160, partial [Gammaproteobacteria bacterium]|nr:hypothetical protein [Gammaproteobacteria bacterium]